MQIETVKIIADTPRGWVIINKEDMKPTDKLFTEPKQVKKGATNAKE